MARTSHWCKERMRFCLLSRCYLKIMQYMNTDMSHYSLLEAWPRDLVPLTTISIHMGALCQRRKQSSPPAWTGGCWLLLASHIMSFTWNYWRKQVPTSLYTYFIFLWICWHRGLAVCSGKKKQWQIFEKKTDMASLCHCSREQFSMNS